MIVLVLGGTFIAVFILKDLIYKMVDKSSTLGSGYFTNKYKKDYPKMDSLTFYIQVIAPFLLHGLYFVRAKSMITRYKVHI